MISHSIFYIIIEVTVYSISHLWRHLGKHGLLMSKQCFPRSAFLISLFLHKPDIPQITSHLHCSWFCPYPGARTTHSCPHSVSWSRTPTTRAARSHTATLSTQHRSQPASRHQHRYPTPTPTWPRCPASPTPHRLPACSQHQNHKVSRATDNNACC